MGGKKGFGTTLSKGGTPVANITNIGGVNMTADTIDVTSNDSTEGYREFIGGLKDGGQVTIEGNFTNDAGQTALASALGATDPEQYIITFPFTPAVTWTFNAIVTAFGTTAPMEGKLGFSATLKVSGKPVLAAAQA